MPRNNSQRQLDNHLTLHGWLNSHFGYKTTRDLLNNVKDVDEGFNPDGHSPVCEFLITRAEPNSAIERALPIYDANIKRHLSLINDKRTQPIVLRYFQYLALLYTEIFLDWKFNRPAEFLRQLNAFVQRRNDVRAPAMPWMHLSKLLMLRNLPSGWQRVRVRPLSCISTTISIFTTVKMSWTMSSLSLPTRG